MNLSNKDFIHFHNHTCFSTFDGLSGVIDIDIEKMDNNIALKARKMGFKAIGITDHGVVAGWIKFINACLATHDKKGKEIPYSPITPIIGEEFYFCRNAEWKSKELQPDGRAGNRHINLFAMNWKGYQNLCHLSEKAWLDGFYSNPRIDINMLADHSEGIMLSTACLSSLVNANLLYGQYDRAKKACSIFKDIFKDHFFLEVMYHGIPEEGNILPDIFKLSSDMNVPIVASNDCHYLNKKDSKTHEVLLCMSQSRCLTDPKRMKFPYDEFYLKDVGEMSKIFGHVPFALTNSLAMFEHFDFNDIKNNLFGGMRIPKFDLPSEFKDPFEYLKYLAVEGLKKHGWANSMKHRQQLFIELQDVKVAKEINGYDFITYFLIIYDFVKFAKSQGIIVGPGRGSGYASVLLRCLDITDGLDPLEYDLIWERFLGFSNSRFILEKDFGLNMQHFNLPVLSDTLNENDLEVDRDYEDDQGGIDRY